MPIKLSRTPGKAEGPIAGIGEHNEEIYGGLLGFDLSEISRLKESGVI